MPDPSDQRHIDALVTLGERDAEPQVRLAALEAATRFVLEPAAWSRIAAAAWRIATALPAGSALRGEVLDFAARTADPLLARTSARDGGRRARARPS